jgi:hypothetical protein
MNARVDEFLDQLETIPWFAKLGKPIPDNQGVKRIYSWKEWPGPEDMEVSEIALRQQALYDEIMEKGQENRQSLEALWNKIEETVFSVAKDAVPYDQNKDAWYGPTAAVWHAGWTAALIGLCLQSDRPIPSELQEQWYWFLRGHWPCSWHGDSPKETFVIF